MNYLQRKGPGVMINKQTVICFLLIFAFFVGCSQKQKQEELKQEQPEPVSSELTLPQIPKISGPYKPTNRHIQIALKNAGYYYGKVDGDVGPMSRKAIEDFQAANDLVADGKVGPKTWAVLSNYLQEDAGSQ